MSDYIIHNIIFDVKPKLDFEEAEERDKPIKISQLLLGQSYWQKRTGTQFMAQGRLSVDRDGLS